MDLRLQQLHPRNRRIVAGQGIDGAEHRLCRTSRVIYPGGTLIVLVATVLVALGCGTSETISSAPVDAPADVPADASGDARADHAPRGAAASDLSLEIIVRAGRDRGELHAGAENRSGHYLLLPDGSLHVGSQGRDLPPRQRILTKDELAAVRVLIARLDDRYEGTPPIRTAGVLPEQGGLRVVIDVREPDSARMTIHAAARGEAVDAEVAAIVRHLAALSWTPDLEPARQQLAPRRYDPGPDPYGRYRRSGTASPPE